MTRLTKSVFISIFSLLWIYSYAANILILEEVASKSHHLWLRNLAEGLIKVDHNVTVLSTFPEIDTTARLTYIHLEKVFDYIYNQNETKQWNFLEVDNGDPISMIFSWQEFAYKVCHGSIESNGWKHLMNYPNEFKFDLIIHDYPSSSCYLAFLQRFNYPPLISATAFYDVSLAILEVNGILTPSISTHYAIREPPKNFFQRTYNYLVFLIGYYSVNYHSNGRLQKLLEHYISDLPNLNDLRMRSVITLINNNPIIDVTEQLPGNVIPVGGLHIAKSKPLPEDLQKIADNAKSGLVIFSLGTNIQSSLLGNEVIKNILYAFGSLPQYTFMWKYETNTLPVPLPQNVHVRKWLPQNDLISHPNTKLLFNHGGLLSTQEAIWYQVPILGLPMFSDQHLNMRKTVRNGVGECIYLKDLTSESLSNKIKQIITTPSYYENMRILSKLFRDQKELPMERAIWWIEWVLRNPNVTNLESPGKYLNILQRQSIDVVSFLTVMLIIILWIVYKLITSLFKWKQLKGKKPKIE